MYFARFGHGCATTSYRGSVHVFVVGGKESGYLGLDSMEVFSINEERWINDFYLKRLPEPLYFLQVVEAHSPDFLVYTVGGYDSGYNSPVSTMYGLTNNKRWVEIGDLKTRRSQHATISVESNDFQGCQSKLLTKQVKIIINTVHKVIINVLTFKYYST